MFLCRTEPVIFKTRFVGWEDVVAVDFTRTTDMLEKREQEMVHTQYVVKLSTPFALCLAVIFSETESRTRS